MEKHKNSLTYKLYLKGKTISFSAHFSIGILRVQGSVIERQA
jgi:hypothetical protein